MRFFPELRALNPKIKAFEPGIFLGVAKVLDWRKKTTIRRIFIKFESIWIC
jgi:hypothetical protein